MPFSSFMACSRAGFSCASSSNSYRREPARTLVRQTLRVTPARSSSRVWKLCSAVEAALAPLAEQIRLLETVPGIDRGSACATLVELGPDLSAFDRIANVATWAGVAPGNNESAGCAAATPRWPSAATARCAPKARSSTGHQQALKARMPYKRAILATAHKLLRTIVAMLRDNRPYIDPGIDYDKLLVARNAARWLRKLAEHGYLPGLRSTAESAAG